MGWCCLHTPHKHGSYHYVPTTDFKDLTTKDKRTVDYVQQRIHGLSYYPPPGQGRSYPSLYKDIQKLYRRYSTPTTPYVAYKGGSCEKTLLTSLHIPCWNLELLGCPSFEHLPRLRTVSSCGQHADFLNNHCPIVETYHFVTWLRRYLNLPYDTSYVNWKSSLIN